MFKLFNDCTPHFRWALVLLISLLALLCWPRGAEAQALPAVNGAAGKHAHTKTPPPAPVPPPVPPGPVEPAPPVLPATPATPFVDNWGGWRAHIGVSAVIGAVGTVAFEDYPGRVYIGCLLPGLAREIKQRREPGNGFSWRDMASNAVGCGLGHVAGGLAITVRDGQTWVFWRGEW